MTAAKNIGEIQTEKQDETLITQAGNYASSFANGMQASVGSTAAFGGAAAIFSQVLLGGPEILTGNTDHFFSRASIAALGFAVSKGGEVIKEDALKSRGDMETRDYLLHTSVFKKKTATAGKAAALALMFTMAVGYANESNAAANHAAPGNVPAQTATPAMK